MGDSLWVFGYGSLVSPESVSRTVGRFIDGVHGRRVAHLDGFCRKWNYGSPTQRGHWSHGDVHVRSGVIICLGVEESDSEICNGVVVKVTKDELVELDWREREYDRVDITDRVRVENEPIDQPVVTYVPRPSAIERYLEARDTGRAAVSTRYWNLVHDAFAELGPHHLDHLASRTSPPDVPVVDVTPADH